MGIPESIRVNLVNYTCCCKECDAIIILPDDVNKRFRDSHDSFYCYRGHSQSFSDKSTEEELKDELAREKRKTQEARDSATNERERADHLGRSRDVYKGKLKATKNRIKNGVCPCCKRTFSDLHEHMMDKHPSYGESGS